MTHRELWGDTNTQQQEIRDLKAEVMQLRHQVNDLTRRLEDVAGTVYLVARDLVESRLGI